MNTEKTRTTTPKTITFFSKEDSDFILEIMKRSVAASKQYIRHLNDRSRLKGTPEEAELKKIISFQIERDLKRFDAYNALLDSLMTDYEISVEFKLFNELNP